MTETWLPVAENSLYWISDYGQVKSYVIYPEGKILKGSRWPPPSYIMVRINGVLRSVHSLVLETFVGPCPVGMEALHDNDVRDDNRLSNLSWGTRSQNVLDSVRNGRHHWTRKTHCKNGHELSGHNLIVTKRQRVCRECARVRSLDYYARKRKE